MAHSENVRIVMKQHGREIGSETWFSGRESAERYATSCQEAAEANAVKLFWKPELQGFTYEVEIVEGLGYAKAAL